MFVGRGDVFMVVYAVGVGVGIVWEGGMVTEGEGGSTIGLMGGGG